MEGRFGDGVQEGWVCCKIGIEHRIGIEAYCRVGLVPVVEYESSRHSVRLRLTVKLVLCRNKSSK